MTLRVPQDWSQVPSAGSVLLPTERPIRLPVWQVRRTASNVAASVSPAALQESSTDLDGQPLASTWTLSGLEQRLVREAIVPTTAPTRLALLTSLAVRRDHFALLLAVALNPATPTDLIARITRLATSEDSSRLGYPQRRQLAVAVTQHPNLPEPYRSSLLGTSEIRDSPLGNVLGRSIADAPVSSRPIPEMRNIDSAERVRDGRRITEHAEHFFRTAVVSMRPLTATEAATECVRLDKTLERYLFDIVDVDWSARTEHRAAVDELAGVTCARLFSHPSLPPEAKAQLLGRLASPGLREVWVEMLQAVPRCADRSPADDPALLTVHSLDALPQTEPRPVRSSVERFAEFVAERNARAANPEGWQPTPVFVEPEPAPELLKLLALYAGTGGSSAGSSEHAVDTKAVAELVVKLVEQQPAQMAPVFAGLARTLPWSLSQLRPLLLSPNKTIRELTTRYAVAAASRGQGENAVTPQGQGDVVAQQPVAVEEGLATRRLTEPRAVSVASSGAGLKR